MPSVSHIKASFKSIADLPNEYHCHRRFYKAIWGDLTCQHCNSRNLKFRSNYEYCPDCRCKTSAKAESIFRNSNLTYKRIYIIIWCWQQKIDIGDIMKLADMSYPTIERWLERLRASLEPSDVVLEDIIEIDGSFFGRLKYGKQKLVAGAINPGSKQLVLQIVNAKTTEAVEEFVNAYIKKGSLIKTDGLASYNQESLAGYDHERCDHDNGYFGPTNHIENVWSVIKRALRHIYRDLTFTTKQLNLILREWENRYNNPELFYNVDSYLKLRGCSKLVS